MSIPTAPTEGVEDYASARTEGGQGIFSTFGEYLIKMRHLGAKWPEISNHFVVVLADPGLSAATESLVAERNERTSGQK